MQNSECKMQNRRWVQLFKVPAFCILHSALLISLAACGSRARAETVPDGPPLAVPLPPAHAIAIEQVAEAPPPEPPAPEPAPPEPRPATTVTRTPAPRETPAPVAAPPAPAAQQPPAEAPAVRATASAADEQRVRELLKKATTDLGNVNYQRLSKEGKSQYDQSKKFSDEAQQAIKEKNFVYALTLADKAATLAAELVR